MKFIVITLSLVCLVIVNGYEYGGEDTYDDYDSKGRGYEEESAPEDLTRPDYDINDAPKLFKKFIKDYNKSYKDDADYVRHYENFVKNLETIIRINNEGHSYVVDIDLFADLSAKDKESLTGGVPDLE